MAWTLPYKAIKEKLHWCPFAWKKPWKNHGKPMEKPWKTHGKTMENPWKTHGKPMEKPWKNHGKPMEKPGLSPWKPRPLPAGDSPLRPRSLTLVVPQDAQDCRGPQRSEYHGTKEKKPIGTKETNGKSLGM